MEDPTAVNVPLLADGDVYLYSHANGAIFVLASDGRSRLVPLAEAEEVVAGCHRAGHRVVVGWDESLLGRQVIERITASEVPVTVYEAPRPPHFWNEGTDALMEAASHGNDRILDDLIERGAAVDRTDDSGSTALHHAAVRGNLHAIEALVAAGADVEHVNHRGFTPHMLAASVSETAAARLLASLGSDPEGNLVSVRFGPSHYAVLYIWPLIHLGLVVMLAAFLWPVSWIDAVLILAAVLAYSRVSPPLAFWAGGVPRRLDGTTLVLRTISGRERTVDLSRVTGAAIGGQPTRSGAFGARWLLLGHPGGRPVDRKALHRLRVRPDELDGVAEHIDRVVVVPVGASKGDEVVVPVGNVLSGRGVLQSRSLRRQLTTARHALDRPPAP